MMRFAACSLLMAGALFLTGCPDEDDQSCPPGQFWDANYQQCVAGGQPQCPPGQTWNGAQCVAGGQGGQCPPGQAWNGAQCVPQQQQCPAGQQWNGTQCVPAGGQPTAGGCSGQAQPIATATGVGPAISAIASQHIPAGSRAVGSPIAGNFQSGQCLEQQIQVQAGKCYTVVGASLGGVSDLDIELVPNIPIPGVPQTAVAQDQTDGPTAVLGGKPNCWTAMIPGPMKLVIRVSGQGLAGAQLYEK